MAGPTTQDVLDILRSIDASLQHLVALAEARAQRLTGAAGPTVSDDADLSSKYGDEKIKFLPRDWSGEDFKGQPMSLCSAPFLLQYAAALDYFAAKNDRDGAKADNGTPKSVYDLRSARRARGWAKRLANGWKPAPAPPDATENPFGNDSVGF
jgi:hypothetical protein